MSIFVKPKQVVVCQSEKEAQNETGVLCKKEIRKYQLLDDFGSSAYVSN